MFHKAEQPLVSSKKRSQNTAFMHLLVQFFIESEVNIEFNDCERMKKKKRTFSRRIEYWLLKNVKYHVQCQLNRAIDKNRKIEFIILIMLIVKIETNTSLLSYRLNRKLKFIVSFTNMHLIRVQTENPEFSAKILDSVIHLVWSIVDMNQIEKWSNPGIIELLEKIVENSRFDRFWIRCMHTIDQNTASFLLQKPR